MTRNEALAIARAHFKALNSANMDFWRRRGQEPVEADFSYTAIGFVFSGTPSDLTNSATVSRSEP